MWFMVLMFLIRSVNCFDFNIFDQKCKLFRFQHFLYQKCKASWLSRPPGANFDKKEKRNLRIQARMRIFRKVSQNALNRVLTVPDYSTRRELSGTTLKIF